MLTVAGYNWARASFEEACEVRVTQFGVFTDYLEGRNTCCEESPSLLPVHLVFTRSSLVKKGTLGRLITILVCFNRQKKVNEVLTALITHLTFQLLQPMSPFVLQMDRPKDCFIKCTVLYQAPLPIPLLEINITLVGGWNCMLSSPTRTNGHSQVGL